jgi:hypothetical protein
MISNACATMRTARSFLPLLRPFIIKLKNAHIQHGPTIRQCHTQPVYKAFNDGHLSLLELLFSVSTGGMGKINSMTDLDVVCQRNVLDFDAATRNSKSLLVTETGNGTYSCVSHFPNNLTSCPSFETSFGSVCTAAIVKLERTRRRPTRCARRVGASN